MTTPKVSLDFLKSDLWDEWDNLESDQKRGVPLPAQQKPPPEGVDLIDLLPIDEINVGQMSLIEAMKRRRSHREYGDAALTFEELSFLLWATQGVTQFSSKRGVALRTVPSAGARHPFETYLLVNNVENLEPGLYRYLPLDHKIYLVNGNATIFDDVHQACYEQYVEDSAVTFIWTSIPYRTEWRYTIITPKLIALDVGHVCQNLYLACESIGAGACAIGGYDQAKMDAALEVDGEEEFAVYAATMGKIL